MRILWKANGSLNLATEATDLPETYGESGSRSDEFQRLKNLQVTQNGVVATRPGSTNTSDSALEGKPNFIIEQDGDRYAFAGTTIYRNEATIAGGLTNAQWSAARYSAFNESANHIFCANGTDRKRIDGSNVYDWGIEAPATAPTLATGASTGLTGTYKARYTYARKVNGAVVSESNPSPESTGHALTNESLSVTHTASTDPQVTHIRVYRTLAGGDVYFHDADYVVADSSLDTGQADIALGSEVALDHDRPPTGTVVAGPFYNGRLFLAKGNLLYWCSAKQPEYWPTTQFIEVGPPQFPILAIVDLGGQAYCLTKTQIWFIQGTGSAFNAIPIRSLAGAYNLHGAVAVEGEGIYHTARDGIYLFAGGTDRKITQAQYEPLFRGESVNGVPAVRDPTSTWLMQYENQIYFGYGNGSILVFNLNNKRTAYQKFDQGLSAPAYDVTNHRFYVGTASGHVRRIEYHDATDDAGAPIEWECESKDFTLQTRRHFPRFVKWDTEGTCTGSLVLDDVVHQEHSISEDRNTRRRLVATGNGKRCSLRLTGTGSGKFFGAETE